MTELVWVADWQIQCCGEEFAVGDEVRWPLVRSNRGYADWEPMLGRELAAELALSYEGHEDPPVAEVPATVRGIRTVSWRSGPHPPPAHPMEHHPIPGSAVLGPVDAIDQWYGVNGGPDGLRFHGWLVDVELRG